MKHTNKSKLRLDVESAGLLWSCYISRIKRGWSAEKALNHPVGTRTKTPRPKQVEGSELAARFCALPEIEV